VAGTQSNLTGLYPAVIDFSGVRGKSSRNANIRPPLRRPWTMTRPHFATVRWLGYPPGRWSLAAQGMRRRPTITVDLLLIRDEPDIVRCGEAGTASARVSGQCAFASGEGLEVQVHDRLVKSAGAQNVSRDTSSASRMTRSLFRRKMAKPQRCHWLGQLSIPASLRAANNVML